MMKPKWQLEVQKRHVRILLLDLALVILILTFTSFIILDQVIIQDLKTDVETIRKLADEEPVLTAFLHQNSTRFLAVAQNDIIYQTLDFNLTPRLKNLLSNPEVSSGVGLGIINGYPKIYVLFKSPTLSILIARRASQLWFYIFIALLVGFLFLFFHIQRLVGYRFLFGPALTKVRFYEKLSEAKETFFAGIFHELGTPLTSLMSRLELLMEQTSDKELCQALENAYLEAQRISFLSAEQLQRARFEMGVVKLNLEKIIPSDFLDSLSFRLEILLKHHEKQLKIESKEHEIFFLGDRIKLEQAMINLITNAIKYAPKGDFITLRTCQTPIETILEVQDQGRGIPEERIKKYLEPFQSSQSNSVKLSSTGLGLFLVNKIVETHKGRLEFKQTDDGFCVSLHIPHLDFQGLPKEISIH